MLRVPLVYFGNCTGSLPIIFPLCTRVFCRAYNHVWRCGCPSDASEYKNWTGIWSPSPFESRFYQQPFTGVHKESSRQTETDKNNGAAAARVICTAAAKVTTNVTSSFWCGAARVRTQWFIPCHRVCPLLISREEIQTESVDASRDLAIFRLSLGIKVIMNLSKNQLTPHPPLQFPLKHSLNNLPIKN